MNNLKVRVYTEQQAKEAQELFFELGYKPENFDNYEYPQYLACCQIDSTFSNYVIDAIFVSQWKEITLQELRTMTKPQHKEYLDPNNNYELIEWDGGFMIQDHWIEVPEGVDCYVGYKSLGYKANKWSAFYFGRIKDGMVSEIHEDHETEYHNTVGDLISRGQMLWQRTQDEPFLTPESVLHGVDATLAERQSTYGDFVHVANTTGKLFAEIKNGRNAHMLPYAHEEALHMICSKIARIVNGDCNHKDSWHDIAGYARLIEESL